MYRVNWPAIVIAVAVAAYAVYGLLGNDLIMPYEWWGGTGRKSTRLLHLRDNSALIGATCLLLGAVGLAMVGSMEPKAPVSKSYQFTAITLIAIGVLFFLGVSGFGQWFVH